MQQSKNTHKSIKFHGFSFDNKLPERKRFTISYTHRMKYTFPASFFVVIREDNVGTYKSKMSRRER